MTDTTLASLTGRQFRERCRSGAFTGPTAGVANGYAQVNLVVLPGAWADEFRAFCSLNPKPCPLLETTKPGQYEPARLAPGADLRTDLPRYRVLRKGVRTESPTSIESLWSDELVAFLIGCSFTFEAALIEAGVPVRHVEQRCNVPMYRTNIQCVPAGRFRGPLVVSMRPMTPEQADVAARVTGAMPRVHGAPVHTGSPASIGIDELDSPDYGDAVTIRSGEVPVFWACGVTPMEALQRAKPDIAITHEPGHMFVTDWSDRSLME